MTGEDAARSHSLRAKKKKKLKNAALKKKERAKQQSPVVSAARAAAVASAAASVRLRSLPQTTDVELVDDVLSKRISERTWCFFRKSGTN